MLNFPNSTRKTVDKIIKFALFSRDSILYINSDHFYFSPPEGMYYDNENNKLVFYLENLFFHMKNIIRLNWSITLSLLWIIPILQ